LTADHLGSTRVVTGPTGQLVARHDYEPFGGEISFGTASPRHGVAGYGASDTDVGPRFTGQLRDFETNLDYFGARYFSGAQGRFTSPDEPLLDQYPEDPQSWNLYSYVRNNPLRFVDPTGQGCTVSGNNYTDNSDPGPDCQTVLAGNGQPQQVNVNDQQGSLAAAIGIGAFIGISNAANDYFAWMFSTRPAALQNIDPGNNRAVTTAAMIAPFLIPGPKGGQATKLLSAGGARPVLTLERLEHIVLRHWATSGAAGAGKFSPGTTARALRGLIEEAVERGVVRPNTRGRAGSIVEYDFGRQIGTDVSGQAASRLRVVLNPDNTGIPN
jgi:RHS repeat-associated protein